MKIRHMLNIMVSLICLVFLFEKMKTISVCDSDRNIRSSSINQDASLEFAKSNCYLFFSNVLDENPESYRNITLFGEDESVFSKCSDEAMLESSCELALALSKYYGLSKPVEVKIDPNMEPHYSDGASGLYEASNIGYYLKDNEKYTVFINQSIISSKSQELLLFSVTHLVLHLFYQECLDSVELYTYDKNSNRSYTKYIIMKNELELCRKEVSDESKVHEYFCTHTGATITDRIITEETISFLEINDYVFKCH